jgi:hypothetical protein
MNSILFSREEKKNALIHTYSGKIFSRKPSILFVSVHKCATSFFSQYVLLHMKGRTNINFQQWHFRNAIDPERFKIVIRKYGYVYGVIRLMDKEHPSFELTERLLSDTNLKGRKVAVLVRDPRDILVSMYYSFGFSHAGSPNEAIWAYQDKRSNTISQMSIDDYSIYAAPILNEKFERLHTLCNGNYNDNRPEDVMLFKYEDMIYDYDNFYERLNGFLELEDYARNRIYEATRPLEKEQPKMHKRLGRPGDYKQKLGKKTIQELNVILEPALHRFGYLDTDNEPDEKRK